MPHIWRKAGACTEIILPSLDTINHSHHMRNGHGHHINMLGVSLIVPHTFFGEVSENFSISQCFTGEIPRCPNTYPKCGFSSHALLPDSWGSPELTNQLPSGKLTWLLKMAQSK